ncbi:MAG TPA: CsbD family protein [Woeseiaceae bacterium]|nr:CsbD family protein [Woeseiaceae bacterium]
MNWDQIEGNWKKFTGQAQQKWSRLTDDDLDRVDGKQQELEGRVQERYGKTREEAKREVDEWRRSLS